MLLRNSGSTARFTATLTLSAALLVGAPAAAQADCVQAPTTKAFAKIGDTADYSVAPGGTFETAAGWTLTGGAKLVYGNETLGITTGSRSLSLPLGATATSPAFCVDETNPYFRFMARPTKAVTGYSAIVLYKDENGTTKQAQFTSSKDSAWSDGKWAPSKVSPLATKIPLVSGETASVQLKFVSTGNQVAVGIGWWGQFAGGSLGTVSIDSVMVDPYRRG